MEIRWYLEISIMKQNKHWSDYDQHIINHGLFYKLLQFLKCIMQLLIEVKISIAHKHLKLQSVQHLLAYRIATISKLMF